MDKRSNGHANEGHCDGLVFYQELEHRGSGEVPEDNGKIFGRNTIEKGRKPDWKLLFQQGIFQPLKIISPYCQLHNLVNWILVNHQMR